MTSCNGSPLETRSEVSSFRECRHKLKNPRIRQINLELAGDGKKSPRKGIRLSLKKLLFSLNIARSFSQIASLLPFARNERGNGRHFHVSIKYPFFASPAKIFMQRGKIDKKNPPTKSDPFCTPVCHLARLDTFSFFTENSQNTVLKGHLDLSFLDLPFSYQSFPRLSPVHFV